MEIIDSQKGKPQLLHNGYRFRRDRFTCNIDGSLSWRCIDPNCKGRVKTLDGEITSVTDHSHGPDPSKNSSVKAVSVIRDRATTGVEKPRQIIQQATEGLPLESASQLPTYNASQRVIERLRKRKRLPYPNPVNVADIKIPDELMNTTRNEAFVLWDSGDNDPERFFIFGTDSNLDQLNINKHWFVDGTFSVAPQMYYQVFTLHTLINNKALPLLYVLLISKTEATYTRLFQKLLEIKPTLAPLSIMTDFEKVCQNAIVACFPTTQLVGCLFHLGQCLWRKVKEYQLAHL